MHFDCIGSKGADSACCGLFAKFTGLETEVPSKHKKQEDICVVMTIKRDERAPATKSVKSLFFWISVLS